MNILISSGLMILLSLSGLSTSCPSACSCDGNRTDCSDLNQADSLDSILDQLSFDTIYLDLSRNNFTTVEPGSFSNVSGLLHLDLSRNLLSKVFPSSFSSLNNLELLDLSENLLVRLPVELFSDLESLTELVLRGNGLKELNPDQFKGLSELRRLDLSSNALVSIPTRLLDGLHSLTWLSLVANRLRTLQRASLEMAPALQHLLLHQNPWNCNCNSIPLKHWLEWIAYTGGHVDSATCSFPSNLNGQDLRSVPMQLFRHCGPFQEPIRSSAYEGHQGPSGDCLRHRYRPISVRRATATVIVAGVVCGVVCVLMVVTATYGCIYAMMVAHEHQQQQRNSPQQQQQQQQPLIVEKEAEQDNLMPTIGKGAEATECVGWMAFPPEVCV